MSAILNRNLARAGGFVAAQAGKAASAASAARVMSAADPFAKTPTISSVSAGLRFSNVLSDSTHSPLI
jgi:hypothetical protein